MVGHHPADTDPLSAHLEHGWEMLHMGKVSAARMSAERVLSLDADSPEGHALLGAIAATEGDAEEAMELLQQALDLDPEYLDAMLYAAELAVHVLADWQHALQLCDEAAPLAEELEDRLDVAVLRIEALLTAGDRESALAAARTMPPPPYPDAASHLRVGQALLELGLAHEARVVLRPALDDESTRAEAHYHTALALESEGELEQALQHFFEVNALDAAAETPAWSTSTEELLRLVEETLAQLPEELHAGLEHLPVRIAELPPRELIAEGLDPRAAVFISGFGGPEAAGPSGGLAAGARERGAGARITDGAGERTPVATCLFVYRRNVERVAASRIDLGHILEHAIAHEAAAFAGIPLGDDPGPDHVH
jgi:tetratricopeptide (TPR) repeat protein